ncbi:hypothetical protein [Gillisia hiemivivida]|uniref:Uncharacterized protein n=1 Tax=Gillisia hiemivivida TaxID=291190 RepID=A0A5C6ZPX7_9FLAO|nr:hypothetical protein [Gillisia hiemivivida]TXD92757.1 hypothetical protein ES724_12570 [Gillisia hiemivivida]
MKTTTLLKRTIRTASFLTILLVLISFKHEKPKSQNSLEISKDLVLNNVNDYNLAITVKNNTIEVERKDVQVVLVIDTDGINNSNLDSKVLFVNVGDTTENRSGYSKNFLTKVYKNKKIQWSAVPQDENSSLTIDVLAIFRKEDAGAEIMEDIYIEEGKKGVVTAKIKNKKVVGIENYSVVFRINEEIPRTFTVDPKLQMGP